MTPPQAEEGRFLTLLEIGTLRLLVRDLSMHQPLTRAQRRAKARRLEQVLRLSTRPRSPKNDEALAKALASLTQVSTHQPICCACGVASGTEHQAFCPVDAVEDWMDRHFP